uniref:Uncharacterized protein n=1 Tax=Meleagris gallopavo TaxID=9103 RepID=G1NIJ1_MELGA
MCLTLGALQQQGECTSPVCPCSVALRIRWSVLFLPAVTSSAMWPNSRASCCPKQLPASLPVCGPQGAFRAALCPVAKPSCLMLLPAAWASRKHSKGLGIKDDFLYSVSVLSGILCTVLAVIKFMLGKVLTSRALITDGFNSLVGGIMGFSILLSAEVFKHNSSVWYLDGSIGVLIGLTIFAYGIKLLIDMVPRVRQTRHYEMFE